MMNADNVPLKMRYILFQECFKTSTLLDGLAVIEVDGKLATRYEHWGAEIPRFTKHLRTWGVAGVVTLKSKATQ